MKLRIHVNQHEIKRNAKEGTDLPTITVKGYNFNQYGHEVIIHGPSRVVYSPSKPLSCGARVWIETDAAVTVYDRTADQYNTLNHESGLYPQEVV